MEVSPAAGAKNGEALDSEERPGESIGGLLAAFGTLSGRIQGPVDLCSDMAESTGESGNGFDCASCCPSA